MIAGLGRGQGNGGNRPERRPRAKTEGREKDRLAFSASYSHPFGIGTHAPRGVAASNRRGKNVRCRETISRTGVTQKGWFSISG